MYASDVNDAVRCACIPSQVAKRAIYLSRAPRQPFNQYLFFPDRVQPLILFGFSSNQPPSRSPLFARQHRKERFRVPPLHSCVKLISGFTSASIVSGASRVTSEEKDRILARSISPSLLPHPGDEAELSGPHPTAGAPTPIRKDEPHVTRRDLYTFQ